MKREIKLIAFDLDGTVLNHGKHIADVTLAAFTKARAHGCVLAAATGRGADMIPTKIMNHPAIDYIICANGAVISERKSRKMLLVREIDRDIAVDIIRSARRYGAGMEIFFADKSYYEWRCLGMMMRFNHSRMKEQNSGAWREMNGFLEFVREVNLIRSAKALVKRRRGAVVKVAAIFKNPGDFECALHDYAADGRVEAASTMGMDIEITAKDVTKGHAIAMLCNILNIEKETVIAFGDSGNDLSMREYVDTFVAMGNAEEAVKAVADRIAPSVSENGVARMLHEIFGW